MKRRKKRLKRTKRHSNPYPARLPMEEQVFSAMAMEIEREVAEHDLSSEMADEKAFVLAERIGNMTFEQLKKHYSFWVIKTGRKKRKKKK